MTAPFNALLIANRGEIAIRIARACADLGIRSVAVFAEDDAASLHVRKADVALPLAGRGVAAYLDMDRLVALALEQGCEAIHPGYGFLAENGEFARRCQRAGIHFVGPQAEVLDLFGDKAAARALAERLEVPLVAGINRAVSVEEAEAFLEGLGDGAAVMLKALAGGGGRGMRAVEEVAQLADAYRRCRAEAQAAFGRDELYVEQRVARARHIEVQVLGDGSGAVSHLWERDCSLQRRQQKLLEIAPSPDLPEATREALIDCALRMAGAVQLRINLETLAADGSARPAVGTIGAYEPPSGPGLRVDGYGYAGYRVSPSYDSLLAKLVVRGADYPAALRRAYRALCEFRLEGVASNLDLLRNLLLHPAVQANRVDTRFVESHLETLLAPIPASHPRLRAECPLAEDAAPARVEAPLGSLPLSAPSSGVLVALEVADGERVRAGQRVAILEAMKMEFEVKAPGGGIVRRLAASLGEPLEEGATLLFLEPTEDDDEQAPTEQALDLAHIRADLAEVLERQAALGDERRPQALARRRKTGQRTARENVLDLLDEGSFSEYGGFALAAQRRRRSAEELLELSPADGLVAGTGTVGAASFGVQAARCLVLAYDYTVFAGTQGVMNHKKTDRLLGLAEQWRLPLVLFAEGGGGRPGDTDFVGVAGLDCHTFVGMARLSGLVPLVGVVSGRCFAGNAALLGCCDVIIATRDATIGMAGPAMIEGGGLGRFAAEEVGPTGVQGPNGVIDVLVEDEAEAVAVARRYLGYFQGPLPDWSCADQRELRHLVPENRLRAYDIRQAIEVLADRGSVLELRRQFAPGLVTALLRIEGRAFGLIANNPGHLGGAIDAAAGDKAARFMQLCDAFDIPIVSLCDTPGFMVGPEAEKQATVRHVSRMFVSAASLTVPFFTVVLRKGYGLGAQAMAAGSFHSPLFTVAWPSGEFGAMGLEGAVRLGFAKELAAEEDPQRREALFRGMVDKAYRNGKALNMASYLEIDAVIDPAETRAWLLRGLAVAGEPAPRAGRKRPFVDTW
ncbi:acetyl-CoA carboxylase family protein [Pseudomonas aeruginosa]|uniref:acetyl-CoA carboxylase family protein n=1 Tax=Pseudomonas aeruginosa TaxID=287 RepID=UPI001A2632C1|nr:carboxyl transferase domain-containing protein [Pseudomonas aeruginosa]MBH3938871.1 carbamoyl-phosphate synthase large subunit [Pseudomonas aeruginosa]MBP8357207.1 carbamoyl-phosphate synthase large subunit [Pseudomonas aeruginosa]MBP8380263.1 carbamoyl-phosphate synthase large subunit [Pseudomonas aeruginosa]HEK3477747.1 carbamoyl-phosphate synthase large subunit [Pseudomonas aeruginosa]